MKRKRNRIIALLLSVMLILAAGTTAYAHDVPDMDRKCSVTVTMRRGENAVGGGAMTIYRVGDVVEDDGNYNFGIAADFAGSGETLADLQATGLADRLKVYAQNNGVTAVAAKDISSAGTVTFDELPVGLYLLVQHKAAPGYTAVAPFLVSLPFLENGLYQYDMTAEPKTEFEPEVKPTEPEPTPPPPPKLPQTGQLWWPVPLLTCGGLLMVSVGFLLNRGKRVDEE